MLLMSGTISNVLKIFVSKILPKLNDTHDFPTRPFINYLFLFQPIKQKKF